MGYVSTLGWGDRLSALLVSLMALRLVLVNQNPFRPRFLSKAHRFMRVGECPCFSDGGGEGGLAKCR